MITCAKNYTKNKQTNKKQTDRTLGQMVKGNLYRQNHTQKHTHTHSQKEKKGEKKNLCSQSPPPQLGMIRCLFRYSTDAGYINLIVEIYSTDPETAGRDFPFSSLFAQLPGFGFGFGPASACRSPEGICSPPRQDGVKGAAASGALAHSGRGEGGVQMLVEPMGAVAGMMLQQPEVHHAFSRGSCPWITGPWQWRAAPAPRRGGVESDLCSHTGFLVAAAAALASHAHLWGPR